LWSPVLLRSGRHDRNAVPGLSQLHAEPVRQYAGLQTPYVLPGNHILLPGNHIFFPRAAAGSNSTGALCDLEDPHGTWLLSDRFDFHIISSAAPPSPRFSNSTGAFPNGQLASLPSAPHVLYGTSVYGGGKGGGAIYSYDTISGKEQLLYSFPAESGHPGFPAGGLMYYDGAFYGTTYVSSVVFKFAP